MATRNYDKNVFGIRDNPNGGKGFWTQIGVAFVNADSSINIKLNYLPADLANTTIQVRDPKADQTSSDA